MKDENPALEESLLKQFDQEPDSHLETLELLVTYYLQTGQVEKELSLLHELLSLMHEAEGKAACLLAIGCAAERMRDFEAAVRYYRQAMAMEPSEARTWYFIHNNLGYSLNQLGRFSEAEFYCRKAIGILPQRHNAYKNLGVALAGLDRRREAAQSFIEATRVCPDDPRSCYHLEEHLEKHPELRVEFQESATECRAAVNAAISPAHRRRRPQ